MELLKELDECDLAAKKAVLQSEIIDSDIAHYQAQFHAQGIPPPKISYVFERFNRYTLL